MPKWAPSLKNSQANDLKDIRGITQVTNRVWNVFKQKTGSKDNF